MRICAAPKVVNKLSRAKRCFLSDSLGLAANNLPLPPLPPPNVSSILQMMAASNLENSQATRELRARLVEGHTKLSTEGSSRSGLVCPSSSENRFSLPPSRRLTPRSQRNRTRNTRFSSRLRSSTIDPSSPMLSREAQEASLSLFPHEAIRRSQ